MSHPLRHGGAFPPFRDALQFFVAGEIAFRLGVFRRDGPYQEGTRESTAWLAGWDNAEDEARELKG